MDLEVLVFSDFGKSLVIGDLGCPPDALVQMALQLAYHRCEALLYKKIRETTTTTHPKDGNNGAILLFKRKFAVLFQSGFWGNNDCLLHQVFFLVLHFFLNTPWR